MCQSSYSVTLKASHIKCTICSMIRVIPGTGGAITSSSIQQLALPISSVCAVLTERWLRASARRLSYRLSGHEKILVAVSRAGQRLVTFCTNSRASRDPAARARAAADNHHHVTRDLTGRAGNGGAPDPVDHFGYAGHRLLPEHSTRRGCLAWIYGHRRCAAAETRLSRPTRCFQSPRRSHRPRSPTSS